SMDRELQWIAICLISLSVSACGGSSEPSPGPGSGGTEQPQLPGPPMIPVISASANPIVPGTEVVLSASSADPQNDSITYAWDFGDGATATGAKASHTYAAEGIYLAKVVATDQHSLSSTSSSTIIVSQLPNIYHINSGLFLGQQLTAYVSLDDPNSLWKSVTWDLGDGTTLTGNGITHQYVSAGTYTVTVTASDGANHSITSQTTVQVALPSAPPPLLDNELVPYCSGAFCGAADAATYSASGVGICRYHNSTS